MAVSTLLRTCVSFAFRRLWVADCRGDVFWSAGFLSTSTSLPEVGGDAAYYWENFDADSMAQVVRQGLTCHNAARVALCKNRRQNFLGRTPRRNICNFIEIYDECHRGIRTNRVIGCAIFLARDLPFAVTDSRVHPPGWDELKKWHPRLKLF